MFISPEECRVASGLIQELSWRLSGVIQALSWRLKWPDSDAAVTSQWCDSGAAVTSQLCDSGAAVTSQWCDSGTAVTSQMAWSRHCVTEEAVQESGLRKAGVWSFRPCCAAAKLGPFRHVQPWRLVLGLVQQRPSRPGAEWRRRGDGGEKASRWAPGTGGRCWRPRPTAATPGGVPIPSGSTHKAKCSRH